MKVALIAAALMVTTICIHSASAAPGDVWSLSGDMQVVSNPSPPIDPGLPGGGTGFWTYFRNSPPGEPFTVSTTNPAADVNGEVPDAGLGWFWQDGNHVMLVKFTTDFNAPAPVGTGNDKTNFKVGDVGGHATIGASWTTNQGGSFLVEWLGYNGRNQAIATPGQQGRTTNLRLIGPGDVVLDAKTIVGGAFDGHANAYTNSMVMPLAAGDTLYLVQEGNDWSGLDLKITQVVPEPGATTLVGIGFAAAALRRRRRLA